MKIQSKLNQQMGVNKANITKTACTLLPYSILDLIKVDTTYLRTVILTASSHQAKFSLLIPGC